EAGGRESYVLPVMQGDALAHLLVDLRGDRVVRDGEEEHLRHGAWKVGHRQLPLPGLADPALLRELLHVAGALPFRVREAPRGPGVQGQEGSSEEENDQQEADQLRQDDLFAPRETVARLDADLTTGGDAVAMEGGRFATEGPLTADQGQRCVPGASC